MVPDNWPSPLWREANAVPVMARYEQILRLHDAGVARKDIAKAVGLGLQRIHQIVRDAPLYRERVVLYRRYQLRGIGHLLRRRARALEAAQLPNLPRRQHAAPARAR